MRISKILAIALTSFCALAAPRELPAAENRYEFSKPLMGVPFRLVFYTTNQAKADEAAKAAFATINRLNDIFSDYEPGSELSLLSKTSGSGRAVPVSPDLWQVLTLSADLSTRSDGAFDITVGPYVKLWRAARTQRRLPNPEALARARKSVGYTNVVLDGATRSAKLLPPEMRLDLGGIAKGFAIDRALHTLAGQGITQALVAGGGDLAVSGPPPGKPGWRVDIPVFASGESNRLVVLHHRGLATSGDTFQRLELDGKRYSHIVDPATGVGLTDHSVVTVIARDCTTADGLATAVSVLGPSRGLALIEATPGTAVRILRQPNETIEASESRGFAQYYQGKESQ